VDSETDISLDEVSEAENQETESSVEDTNNN
jgi:hypothetical protein